MAIEATVRAEYAEAVGQDVLANRAAEQELQNFLEAVSSYPERFARDPQVSFGEHLVMVAAAGHGSSRI